MFSLKNNEMLTYFLLIIVCYTIAKMFSRRCEGFSVGAATTCPDISGSSESLYKEVSTCYGTAKCNFKRHWFPFKNKCNSFVGETKCENVSDDGSWGNLSKTQKVDVCNKYGDTNTKHLGKNTVGDPYVKCIVEDDKCIGYESKKKMKVKITDFPNPRSCEDEHDFSVNSSISILGWSETDAPNCKSNQCSGDDIPIHNAYINSSEIKQHQNFDNYDGEWHNTGLNSGDLSITDDLCYYTEHGYKKYHGCISGTRALCGYKINPAKNGKGGKCKGVKGGIPGYCKKDEYCCNGDRCCPEPCNIKSQTCRV